MTREFASSTAAVGELALSNKKDEKPKIEQAPFPELEYIRLMVISQECDRREGILVRQGKGWIQVEALGHEPPAVLAYHLGPDDYVFAYYRDRPLMMSRGTTLEQIARDYLAVVGSTSEGRSMAQHISDRELNLFPAATPTTTHCLPAVGVAWGLQMNGGGNVSLCTIGDASTRQGEFFEAVTFAVQENLPIVFVVEDNHYGISTPTENMLPFRLRIFREDLVTHVDGRNVYALHEKGGQLIERARTGDGPGILWCELDRLGSHTNSDDQRKYRSPEDIQAMLARNPVVKLAESLIADGKLTTFDFEQMQEDARKVVDEVYLEMDREPAPSIEGVYDHLFAPPVEHSPLPIQPDGDTATMVSAMNQTFRAGLEEFPNMVFFGEDIEDPKGGVFGFTKGLSTDYPERVLNSPLAEATIIGAGVGLATMGYRPVFEIQFIDFITPGLNQLATQAATLHWRSKGDWKCPLILYAPYGAYLPGGGPYHSQCNDGWWAHTPGLRVAVPSTAEDVAGLFWSAFHDEDPTLILLPKHIFRARMPVSRYEPVPFGKAAIRNEGSDVTIVSWGNCIELAEKAAKELESDSISLEIIDLRTLVPCDWETVAASLAKTGRLVVVHEDNRTCGFGQAVISEMTSQPDRFNTFLSPPQLVSRGDVHVPFHADLEYAVLPDLEDVLEAVYTTME